ncbi:PKD domain-containing protein [Nocardioides sp.]|uniref:PKD domain-containing protein n=1 Tax=Nocardioides sp. TaxID=35761 RepID=UPI00260E77C0|nr:PKD domain-containing protein [Nocardioides sp.]MCW2738328.1 Immune inhibitor peptidase [Nocardioides sp.]
MPRSHRLATVPVAVTALLAGMLTVTAVATSGTASATSAPASAAVSTPVASVGTVGGLEVENSFVSAVGWVKPGDTYPSRIIVRNTSGSTVSGATVDVVAPVGSTIVKAGAADVEAGSYTWEVGTLTAGASRTLVLESRAAQVSELATVVWRDLSTTATVLVGGASKEFTSHGPKVIPPGEEYDTARYGDRPFPVVPVAYTDRDYVAHDTTLDQVINDPGYEGSTFNLFQEMSLGQLYPEGTVPSTGKTTADFAYGPGFPFSKLQLGNTCTAGVTVADSPIPAQGTPLYPERIQDGVYQLPGNTAYYGADANGSALAGAVAGVGALQSIDSGCGPAGKLVLDAAAIADPEIDYSDYDTDKDGVVDFFMAVFAGCGGNGASQLSVAGCPQEYGVLPYDNVWPHSSSLEFYYSDPVTKLPGFTTDDQLKDLEGRPLWYTDTTYSAMTTADKGEALKVYVRVGPYNVNPETAIDAASVISHEYGHSLGLPDFYSTGGRETYGDWNLMATDKSHHIDAFGRQELGWVVPEVLDSSRTESAIPDSKQDTDTITWQTPAGDPYTLTEGQNGVGRVQNSQMYVAKLPGRVLLDPAKFDSGDTATASHTWWSRSGNDFGCAKDPGKGHNIDVALPEVASLPVGTTLSADFKSMWDIEWDYDYGFVLTSTDGGKTFSSNPSENGYTTSNTDPLAGNPNQNACQQAFDNGITGTSGSYDAGSEALDRKVGNTPEMVYLADRYDVSELVGKPSPVLRFSYSTDPGLARPGWFIDDLTVTATLPDGTTRVIYGTDFETSGTPEDLRIFNGGCRADGPGGQCTQGWQYVAAGAEGPSDHAYYMEMRDRSGFDLDGNGQIDRDAIAFASGFYTAYTDEAHGYGNAGTDDPPAQSPLDSQPEPGSNTPDLSDAAWTATAGDSRFSDGGEGWTDNYADPSSPSGNWEFDHDCLTFEVLRMTGNGDGTVAGEGPQQADGDLTGDVAFTLGAGCGTFDYGWGEESPPAANTAPEATATATPSSGVTGTRVVLDASGSTDAETPDALSWSWDFGNGGPAKDAEGAVVEHTYANPGTYDATVTVSDAGGLTDTATVRITISDPGTTTPPTAPPTTPPTTDPTPGTPGLPSDPQGPAAGSGEPTVTVSSSQPATLPRTHPCQGRSVGHLGSWRVVRGRAPGGSYCDNGGTRRGRDVLRLGFQGDTVALAFGRARRGGKAVLFIDGERVGVVSFAGRKARPRLDRFAVVSGLGIDRPHRLRLVVKRGSAFVEGFRTAR